MPERRFIVRGGFSVLQNLAYAEDVGGLGGVVSQASFRRSYVMSAAVHLSLLFRVLHSLGPSGRGIARSITSSFSLSVQYAHGSSSQLSYSASW
jgi:hypothetical protein